MQLSAETELSKESTKKKCNKSAGAVFAPRQIGCNRAATHFRARHLVESEKKQIVSICHDISKRGKQKKSKEMALTAVRRKIFGWYTFRRKGGGQIESISLWWLFYSQKDRRRFFDKSVTRFRTVLLRKEVFHFFEFFRRMVGLLFGLMKHPELSGSEKKTEGSIVNWWMGRVARLMGSFED